MFRFASSVQSCYGEGRALQTDTAVCGEHSPCSGHTGFAPYRGVCAFPVYSAQAPGCSIWSRSCVECSSSFRVLHKSAGSVAPAFCAFPGLSGSGSQRLGAVSPGVVCLFSPQPQCAHRRSGLRTSFDRNRGPFAVWEGVASLGLSLPLSPTPCLLPPGGMGRLFSGVSQSLCFANRRQRVRAG